MAGIARCIKILKEGVEYRLPENICWVIRRIGTDSAEAAQLEIQGNKMGVIDSTVAPLRRTSSNKLGPLELGELYYVVAPGEFVKFHGASGSVCMVDVEVVPVTPGAGLPAAYAARHGEQGNHHLRMFSGKFSLGTDAKWPKNAEYEVLSLTPLTTEKIILNGFFGIKVTGNTVNPGDFAFKLKLGNIDLELDAAKATIAGTEVKLEGTDVLMAPLPPSSTDGEIPFTFKDYPIEVPGDQTLSIRVKNVSGSDKSPASGSSWEVEVKFIAEYIFKAR